MSATFLRNRITGSLKASPIESIRAIASHVSPNVVFSNPTLTRLVNHLLDLISGKASTADPKAEIERMIEKYSTGLQSTIPSTPATRNKGHVVLITGSTGGLGSYILASLLIRKDVIRVYALNRRSKTTTSAARQRSGFEDRGLDINLLESQQLVYVDGDTSQEQLGLDRSLYEEVGPFGCIFCRSPILCVTGPRFDHCHNPQRLAVGFQPIPVGVRTQCSRNSVPN